MKTLFWEVLPSLHCGPLHLVGNLHTYLWSWLECLALGFTCVDWLCIYSCILWITYHFEMMVMERSPRDIILFVSHSCILEGVLGVIF